MTKLFVVAGLGFLFYVFMASCFGPYWPKGFYFDYKYGQIQKGMLASDVDETMRAFRKESHNFIHGVLDPPAGGVWLCSLGGTNDLNRIVVSFEDGRVVDKQLLWEEWPF